MKPKDGYTAKQKVIIGVWAGILVWILAMTIRSTDWRFADRSSVGLAPLPEDEKGAVVQVYAARTYSWRGAFAVHSWVAVKPENAKTYTIYQVMGWYLRRGLPAVSVTQESLTGGGTVRNRGWWVKFAVQMLPELFPQLKERFKIILTAGFIAPGRGPTAIHSFLILFAVFPNLSLTCRQSPSAKTGWWATVLSVSAKAKAACSSRFTACSG